MKKILIIIGIIGAIIFLDGISQSLEKSNDTNKQNMVLQNNINKYPIQTYEIKKDTIKTQIKLDTLSKLTDIQRKQMEYLEWKQRSKNIDKNFDKLNKQSELMDSLIKKKK